MFPALLPRPENEQTPGLYPVVCPSILCLLRVSYAFTCLSKARDLEKHVTMLHLRSVKPGVLTAPTLLGPLSSRQHYCAKPVYGRV
jgi:hypothetical protein